MKETKNFKDKVQQLLRSLKRRHRKIDYPDYKEPVDALVFAVLCEHSTTQQTLVALKRIKEYFLDLNDLRVSRPEEIVEACGPDTGVTNQTALNLTLILKAIFDKFNSLSLADLKRQGKKEIRDTLRRFGPISEFVLDYCMLTAFEAHAIPLTANMVEYLKAQKLIEPDLPPPQISLMLARQIAAKDAYTFYALLRKETEQHKSKKQKKPKTRTPEPPPTETAAEPDKNT